MNKNKKFAIVITRLISLLGITSLLIPATASAVTATQIISPYVNYFGSATTVVETGSMAESGNGEWWVNSGARMISDGARGSTVKGELPSTDPWRILYNQTSSTDTDNGYHPQNLFRLLTRSKWTDARSEAYFVIKKHNVSTSSNRNQSNGLLLMNRYQDGQTLYYAGVRVDGSAIIKKKKNGIYYTLAEIKNVYPGVYDKDTNPNLLPKDKWIGLRVETKNQSNGSVKIDLYLDKNWQGNWQLVASAVDNGLSYGGAAITSPGYAGIRTDFMDVEFENFRLRNI